MLKKFFISMLGSMAALWLSLFIFIVGMFFTIGVIIGKNVDASKLTADNILYIKLEGTIADRAGNLTFTDLLNGEAITNDPLDDILTAIDRAATDNKVKGIYLDCYGSELGMASRGELIEALKNFKQSGKWVYAYADEYTQGDYYIASVADEIYLNPVGQLDIRGLASTTMFFKDVLAKLGVEVQIVKVGSYKSAVEPFIRMDMSEPSREQTLEYVDQLWGVVSGTIAANRGIDTLQVNMMADSMAMTWAPDRYIANKTITELKYRSQVEDMLRKKLGIKDADELPLVTPSEYIAGNPELVTNVNKPHIAVYYAVGDIVEDGKGGIVGQVVTPDILKLAKDDNVKGLVLRVNSGGGSAFASEQIWHALEEFKAAGKPFYVSMGDYAASGGYYISSGADVIYADPATITGSIGIFGMIPNAHELIVDKIGLGLETVASNPNATAPSIYEPMTADQLAAMQSYVERGYETFVSRVAKGRDLSTDSVKAIGGGRVWTGLAAVNLGLVDQLGTLDDAVKAMTEKTGVKAVTSYPKTDAQALDMLIKMASGNMDVDLGPITNTELQQVVNASQALQGASPIQARMPYIIIK